MNSKTVKSTIDFEVLCVECGHINEEDTECKDLWNTVNTHYCDECGNKNVDIELLEHILN